MIPGTADEREIYRALARLARAMDARDWAAVGAILAPDATAELGTGTLRGPDEITGLMRSFLDQCGPSRHLLGNVLIDLDPGGQTAVSRAYVSDLHLGVGPAAGLSFESLGDYHDRWVRRDGRWRLAHRTKVVTGTVGTTAVLGPGPDGFDRAQPPAPTVAGPGARADAVAAITDLLYAYAERIDGGRLDAAAELFSRARIRIGGADIDADGLAALWRRTVRIHDDGTPRTKHVITNPQVTVDTAAGTAEARSYYTVLQAAPGLELQVIAAGRYRDAFARDGSGWHFTFRDYSLFDFAGRTDAHLIAPGED